jgi:hypothetical protein
VEKKSRNQTPQQDDWKNIIYTLGKSHHSDNCCHV